jgi:hypothetical protein
MVVNCHQAGGLPVTMSFQQVRYVRRLVQFEIHAQMPRSRRAALVHGCQELIRATKCESASEMGVDQTARLVLRMNLGRGTTSSARSHQRQLVDGWSLIHGAFAGLGAGFSGLDVDANGHPSSRFWRLDLRLQSL